MQLGEAWHLYFRVICPSLFFESGCGTTGGATAAATVGKQLEEHRGQRLTTRSDCSNWQEQLGKQLEQQLGQQLGQQLEEHVEQQVGVFLSVSVRVMRKKVQIISPQRH